MTDEGGNYAFNPTLFVRNQSWIAISLAWLPLDGGTVRAIARRCLAGRKLSLIAFVFVKQFHKDYIWNHVENNLVWGYKMSQRRFTLLISTLVHVVFFHQVFVVGQTQSKAEGTSSLDLLCGWCCSFDATLILAEYDLFDWLIWDLCLLSVPGKPVNVSVGEVNDSSIELSWAEPLNPNGVIKGYRIYFMRKNFTDVQTVRGADPAQKFILTELGSIPPSPLLFCYMIPMSVANFQNHMWNTKYGWKPTHGSMKVSLQNPL